jgi:tartrate-resistant acid phosphatase type 5
MPDARFFAEFSPGGPMRRTSFGCVLIAVAGLIGITPMVRSAAPTTAPTTRRVDLLAMGDWGTNGPGQKQVAAAMSRYVADQTRPIDGMLLVGDNFYMALPGGTGDPMWNAAFERMYDPAVLKFPFYAVLGNHDYQNGKDRIELDYAKLHPESRWKLPARWYRQDFPADHPLVTALMLDSDKDSMSKEQWEAEKTWLAGELAKPRGTWTVCCAHHPLFSNGGHGDNPILQNEWGKLFVQHNVDFYICGHDHDLQHLQIPDWFTSFVLVGGGGADVKLMRHDDRGPLSRLTHGFGHLSFTGDQAVVTYINADGKVLHQFTRTKAGKVTVQIEGGDDKAAPNPLRALEGFGGYTPPATKPAK